MADFFSTNALYLVLAITLICWGGILVYLFRVDKRITQIEKEQAKG
jgi:CcmD family protein